MPDLAGAYRDARERMCAMVAGLDEDPLERRIPACPEWTVRDLIAHVSSIATEITNGAMPADLNLVAVWDPDVARRREGWIDESLERRRGMSIDELLDEWTRSGEMLDAMLRGEAPMPVDAPPLVEWIVVTDIGAHLQDLATALGNTEHRDALATGLSLRSYVEGMRIAAAQKGTPAMKIRAGSREWVVGDGEPVATVTADPWELSRAVSGRRSLDQVRAYDWEGDPEGVLELFYPYGVRADSLEE
jgi:uncharacterized protein (TIGR03083 family)